MNKMKRILTAVLALTLLMALTAPTLANASTSYIWRRLEYGDSGDDVTQLQKSLKKLGLFKNKVSGVYLDSTVLGVQSYEYLNGHTTTRSCSVSMQKRIHDDSSKKANRTLHYGDSGDDVKEIQKALKKLGFFNGTIGGNYLTKTRAAVKAFEAACGYKQTSYCSPAMQKRIRNAA